MALFRLLFKLSVISIIVWAGTAVPFGKRTLFGHLVNIWHSDQARELRDGVNQVGGPMIEKVERGMKAGLREAGREPVEDSAVATSPQPPNSAAQRIAPLLETTAEQATVPPVSR